MTSENPDFLIDTHLASRETWSRGMGGTRYRFEEEKLLLRFMDARSNNLLWRGEATGMLNASYTREELNELLKKAAQEILEDFPPASQKMETTQRGAPDITFSHLRNAILSERVPQIVPFSGMPTASQISLVTRSIIKLVLQAHLTMVLGPPKEIRRLSYHSKV